MSWVKLDDDLPTHPKFGKLTTPARWRFIELLCLSSKYKTDGVLDVTWLRPAKVIKALEAVRLLDRDGDELHIGAVAELAKS